MASAARDAAAAGSSARAEAEAEAEAPYDDASGAGEADDSAWLEDAGATALGGEYDEEYEEEEEEEEEEDIRPRALPVDGEPDFESVRVRLRLCVRVRLRPVMHAQRRCCRCCAAANTCAVQPYAVRVCVRCAHSPFACVCVRVGHTR